MAEKLMSVDIGIAIAESDFFNCRAAYNFDHKSNNKTYVFTVSSIMKFHAFSDINLTNVGGANFHSQVWAGAS